MSVSPQRSFERMAVLGLGLLGGSTALAARQRGVVSEVLGYARRRGPLEGALDAGVIDGFGTLPEVVGEADLVVLGTPVDAMPTVLKDAAPHLRPGTIVTDVGSVKESLASTLPPTLPEGVHFVGSHPMAGSHVVGVEHADPDLFVGRSVVVTPTGAADEPIVERLSCFWEALGAVVTKRSPAAHDQQVAWVSHLPHLIAYGFAHAFQRAPEAARALTGTGFQDFTRIARSDPEMWAGILLSNRKSLKGPLQDFRTSLAAIADAVEDGDAEAIVRLLTSAQDTLTGSEVPSASPPVSGSAQFGGIKPENQAASTGDARRLEEPNESS